MAFLGPAVVFLLAAVLSVSLFRRTGLGSVMGYLVAGVVIGPHALRFVEHAEGVMGFAELGVVLLLFIIGLELQPARLRAMRYNVFALGGLQVAATTVALALAALALGLAPLPAVVVGFSLSLSSTALVLQVLAERNQLTTHAGRLSFGVLLFQDLAAIPVIALLPFLGGSGETTSAQVLRGVGTVAGTLVALVAISRVLLRPVLKQVAALRSQELFTASALLVVAGTALALEKVGLSATLGAFLAGVLLADSEYRHELEADIEPFKGLLLGLFFMGVGMEVNLELLAARPVLVAALVTGLFLVKGVVLFAIGRWKGGDALQGLRLAVSTSQGGEFAFVLFGFATTARLLDAATSELLVVLVGVSLAASPVLYALSERFLAPRLAPQGGPKRDFDAVPDQEEPVLIAGFGRVGQVVGRVLSARRVPFVALDASPEHVDFVRRFGNEVFYGDASRVELLEAAGASKARFIVVAIDDVEASLRTVRSVQQHFPHLTILARARNRQHAYELMALGIRTVIRETFGSSLELTHALLVRLGVSSREAGRALERFRALDEKMLEDNFQHRGNLQQLQASAARGRAELEKLFEADASTQVDDDAPPAHRG